MESPAECSEGHKHLCLHIFCKFLLGNLDAIKEISISSASDGQLMLLDVFFQFLSLILLFVVFSSIIAFIVFATEVCSTNTASWF